MAGTDATVLVRGPSGTGKELIARAVHGNSPRRGSPLVTVNCATLQESLLESELFGHERGAFTGADKAKPGLIEAAEGGTLFIDEVAEMTPALQAKLLRVLEDGYYRRVGSTHERRANVRVIEQVRDGLSTAYSYDAVDQLVQEGDGTSITYDANGNRLADGSGSYTYTTGNELLTAPNGDYIYDANGNVVVERRADLRLGYDLDERLAWVESGPAEHPTLRVDYLYDAWGNQVGRAVTEFSEGEPAGPAAVERHLVDGWKVAQDFWGNTPERVGNEAFDVWADVAGDGTLLARRVFGDGVDEPLVALGSALPGGRVWYFQDRLGSVVAEVDGNGHTHTATYTAWGGLGAGSELVDRYGWTGREHDWATALINLRDRYYDPTAGRFIQEDPAETEVNPYRYAHNSPTNATDPSGRQEKPPQPAGGQKDEVVGVVDLPLNSLGRITKEKWEELKRAGLVEILPNGTLLLLVGGRYIEYREDIFVQPANSMDGRGPQAGDRVHRGFKLVRVYPGTVPLAAIQQKAEFEGCIAENDFKDGVLSFIIHLPPGGAALDYAYQGEWMYALGSGVADAATVGVFSKSKRVVKLAIAVNGVVVGYQAYHLVGDLQDGKWGAAGGRAGEIVLRVVIMRSGARRIQFLTRAEAEATQGAATGGKLNNNRPPQGNTTVQTTPKPVPPLAHVLEGHGAEQGFTGVFDSTTGKILIKPSTAGSNIPPGWVARRGGHADVSRAMGGNAANHQGFAVILQKDGTLAVTWRSGVLNQPPDYVVPPGLRKGIIDAIEAATGKKVCSH